MSTAKINNQEIYFEDSGGCGPAIVFMHGFLLDQSLFDSQVEILSPRYRCIRWDARGFGQTQWDGKAFSLNDSVSDCFGLMDHLGVQSAVLIGMSQGGYCALRAALLSPERVKALVLMSTRSGVDEEPVKAAYREMRDTWRQFGPITLLMEGLATGILGSRELPGMKVHWDRWLPRWKEISGEAIFHVMNNLLDRDEMSHRLKEIVCPALVTHGSEDAAMPVRLGEALSKELSNCRGFVVAPGAHAVNLTHSEIINPRLMKFLDEVMNDQITAGSQKEYTMERPVLNSAFFGLYENVFFTAKENYGEEFALQFMRSLFERALAKAYLSEGFEKGVPSAFLKVVGLRDESVGLQVDFPEVSDVRIVYRFLNDPFPGLKGHVDPEKLCDTFIRFKVNFLLGDHWNYKLTCHCWNGAPFTEFLIFRK